MQQILVADDLTGASDAGVQFTKAGLRATVWLDYAGAIDVLDTDVLVVDLDSRAVAPDVAYQRMRDVLARLHPASPRAIVKKMDSTLRGNVAAELRAMLAALPQAFAVVCPAYPKNQRTVRDGILFVDGVPVDRTDFGRDLFSPVKNARIAAPFDEAVLPLGLDLVRAGTVALNRAIDEARTNGTRIAIPDAETDDDLRTIAALDRARDDLLWVGSAGVVEVLDRGVAQSGQLPPAAPAIAGPVLFLVGSISAMTQRQIDDYGAHGSGTAERIDPLDVLNGRALSDAVSRAHTALRAGRDALLALNGDRARVEQALAWGRERGWDALRTSRALRDEFIGATGRLVTDGSAGAVVLSGGDIARTFCEAHGVRGMTLLAEAAPGIPLSRAIGADCLLVTKAGGFGQPQTYRDIVATLRSQVTA